MLNFQIDKEIKELLKDFIKELRILNEHLADIKEMVASVMGFRIVGNKEKWHEGCNTCDYWFYRLFCNNDLAIIAIKEE